MSNWLENLRAATQRSSLRKVAHQLDLSPATISLVLRGLYMHDPKNIEAKVLELLPQAPWLQALRVEKDRTNQRRAADRLGVSEATVSQVLSGSYKADSARIERRVRGELMGEQCDCPVLMEISLRVCQDVQERKRGEGSNPQYQQAWFACRGQGRFERQGPCPHFCGQGTAKEAPK